MELIPLDELQKNGRLTEMSQPNAAQEIVTNDTPSRFGRRFAAAAMTLAVVSGLGVRYSIDDERQAASEVQSTQDPLQGEPANSDEQGLNQPQGRLISDFVPSATECDKPFAQFKVDTFTVPVRWEYIDDSTEDPTDFQGRMAGSIGMRVCITDSSAFTDVMSSDQVTNERTITYDPAKIVYRPIYENLRKGITQRSVDDIMLGMKPGCESAPNRQRCLADVDRNVAEQLLQNITSNNTQVGTQLILHFEQIVGQQYAKQLLSKAAPFLNSALSQQVKEAGFDVDAIHFSPGLLPPDMTISLRPSAVPVVNTESPFEFLTDQSTVILELKPIKDKE